MWRARRARRAASAGAPPPAWSLKRSVRQLERQAATLMADRDRYEAVIEGLDDGVVAIDARGRVEVINSAAKRLLSATAVEDALGRPLVELVRTPEVVEAVAAVAAGAGARFQELDLSRQGKPPATVAVRATPRGEGAVVLTLQDVTQLRRLETVRRDFVANVSHELRTPVAVVRANAETLLDGALDDPEHARRFLEGILRSSERMGRLLADLLDIGRIEAGAWPLSMVRVTPLEACRRAAAHAAQGGEAAEQVRTLSVDEPGPAGPPPDVLADPGALDQVLGNLVDNALKYAGEGGSVRLAAVAAAGPPARVRFEVRDDGPGVAPEHRARLFERFYRVDPGRSRQMGGTGLGLAIVKHLAIAMGGRAGMTPAMPKGSCFWVELPAVEANPAPSEGVRAPAPLADAEPSPPLRPEPPGAPPRAGGTGGTAA